MTDTAPPVPAILAVAAAAAATVRIDASQKSVPYRCPECADTENFYGILRFDGMPTPVCPNHGEEIVELVPSR